MVLSDSLARRRIMFPGLPELSDTSATNKTYFQLAGRVLLIFLFLGLIFRGGTWTLGRIAITMFGLLACVMVAVGFKAKYSAVVLVAMLSIFNVFINNFWSVASSHPHRDFLKYPQNPPYTHTLSRPALLETKFSLGTTFSKRFRLSAGFCCSSKKALGD